MDGSLQKDQIRVEAWGTVSGSLPAVPMLNSTVLYYPPYSYRDLIGGVGTWTPQ